MSRICNIVVALSFASVLMTLHGNNPADSVALMGKIMPELPVYGNRNDFGVESSLMGAVDLSVSQIRSVPQAFGETDVMKSLQRLPGVQQANDNHVGILVRGGNYDQNLVMLDGGVLYNPEHLKGFVSAVNPDMVDNVAFYRGGFPSRYGGRLSSVIDIGVKDGDISKYHGSLDVGVLSSKLHLEGPIWKNHTSFNIGVRASYFNAIVYPALKAISNEPEAMQPYSDMDYYDVTGKFVHRFSNYDKLSALIYFGNDDCDDSPTDDVEKTTTETISAIKETIKTHSNRTVNNWRNFVSNLYWTHMSRNGKLGIATNVSHSRYDYMLHLSENKNIENYSSPPKNPSSKFLEYHWSSDSYAMYDTKVRETLVASEFSYLAKYENRIGWGGTFSIKNLDPMIGNHRRVEESGLGLVHSESSIDKNVGHGINLVTAALYVDDDWKVNRWLRLNAGLRYNMYGL